jgi:hypothetical protein
MFGSSYFGTLARGRLGLRGLSPAEPMCTSCRTNGNGGKVANRPPPSPILNVSERSGPHHPRCT